MISSLINFLGRLVRRLIILAGKAALTLMLVLGVILGWTLFLFWSHALDYNIMSLVVVIGGSAAAGLLARWILKRHGFILSWLSAWLSLAASLMVLHNFTGGKVGFSILQNRATAMNWNGLWQMSLGAVLILLPLSAWRKRINPHLLFPKNKEIAGSTPQQPLNRPGNKQPKMIQEQRFKAEDNRSPASRVANHKTAARASAGVLTGRVASEKQGNSKTTSLSINKLNKSGKPGNKSPERVISIPRPRRSKGRSVPIRLVGTEEHRCPYCLEVVDPRDPAGVKVCEVCHSYHHKSCWDVTGTCQVPHLHG